MGRAPHMRGWRLLVLTLLPVLCAGCPGRGPVEITAPAPNARFAGGQEILFSAVIRDFAGDRITARWDFGDGTAADGLTARHAYDGQGLYTATVTVTNEFTSTASDLLTLEIISSRFVKLGPDGGELDDGADAWAMVRDETTGLVWEVKNSRDYEPDYANPHDSDNTYTWYDDNPLTNGGDSGTPGDGTDTADFIDAVNGEALGGHTDWRMPGCDELASIRDSGRFNPAVNTAYFPETAAWYYWSATSYADPFAYAACHIDFFGLKQAAADAAARVVLFNHYGYKSLDYHARAVREVD